MSIEELEAKVHDLANDFDVADQNLVDALRRRIEQGSKIKDKAEALIVGKNRHSLQDLTLMAIEMRSARLERLKIAEVDELKKRVDEFLMFQKVYGVLFAVEPINFESLQNGKYMSIEEDKPLEDIVEEAESLLDGPDRLEANEIAKIKEVCGDLKPKEVHSEDLKVFFEKVSVLLWKEDAKNMLTSESAKTSKDIERFIQNMPELTDLTEHDQEFVKKMEEEGEKIRSWKEGVQNFLSSEPEGLLLEILDEAEGQEPDYEALKLRLMKINFQVNELQTSYITELNVYSDLGEEGKVLQKFLNWSNWETKAIDMRKQVDEERKPLKYDDIKKVVEELSELGLPRERGLCAIMVRWHDKLEEVKREYVREYQQKRIRIKANDVDKFKTRKLTERNIGKMSRTNAESMLTLLRSVNEFAILTQEVEVVRGDLQACEDWARRVRETSNEFVNLLDVHEGSHEENPLVQMEEEVSKRLNGLKNQMVELSLREERAEKELMALEWKIEAAMMLNGIKRDSGYEEWRSLLRAGERPENSDETVEKLAAKLKDELREADRIKGFLEKLKKVEDELRIERERGGDRERGLRMEEENRKVTFEELVQAVAEFENCKVSLREEKRELDKFFSKTKNIKQRTAKLLHRDGERPVLLEFTNMQEHIKKLPVSLSDEYSQLEEVIVDFNKLDAEAKRQQLNNDFKAMEEIVGKYHRCPVFNNTISKMETMYQKTKISYEKIREKEADVMRDDDEALSWNDLNNLSDEIDKLGQMEKTDPSLKRWKKNIFLKKCHILQKQVINGIQRSQVIVNLSQLQVLKQEGVALQRQFGNEEAIQGCMAFVEQMLRDTDRKVLEIQREKDPERLESMAKIVLGFVDLTGEIIERKASLTTKPISKMELAYDYNVDFEKERKRELERKNAPSTEPVKRKRGRPRKGEEKNPPKERKPANTSNNRSKDKSREAEKRGSVNPSLRRREEEMRASKSWVRENQRPMKKLTSYYDADRKGAAIFALRDEGKRRAALKETDPLVIEFKNLLEANSENIRVSLSEFCIEIVCLCRCL